MSNENQISSLLKTLFPKTQEDLALLRSFLACALYFQDRASLDLGLDTVPAELGMETKAAGEIELELQQMIQAIPEDAIRYFHGLVEAVQVYQSIYGQPLRIQNIGLSDKSFHELRQIRDMCLDDGLHSIY